MRVCEVRRVILLTGTVDQLALLLYCINASSVSVPGVTNMAAWIFLSL